MRRLAQLLPALALLAVPAAAQTQEGVSVNGVPLEIPPAYFWEPENPPSGALGGINLFMVLPDLAPRGPENEEAFNSPGYGPILSVGIFDLIPEETAASLFARGVADQSWSEDEVDPDQTGWQRLSGSLGDSEFRDWYVWFEGGVPQTMMWCIRASAAPFPTCFAYTEFEDDFSVTIGFDATLLDKAAEIRARVLARIATFRAAGAAIDL